MLDQVPVTYTTYTIREEDLKQVGDVPGSRAEQAKLKWMPYASLLEFVAERFHSAETYIQKLNPGKDWEHLQAGRNSQGAKCLAVRSREIHRRKSA